MKFCFLLPVLSVTIIGGENVVRGCAGCGFWCGRLLCCVLQIRGRVGLQRTWPSRLSPGNPVTQNVAQVTSWKATGAGASQRRGIASTSHWQNDTSRRSRA